MSAPAIDEVSRRRQYKHSALESATYSLKDLAGLMGVSYTVAHEQAQAGTLPVPPIRIGKQYRFPKRIVDRMLGIDDTADPGK